LNCGSVEIKLILLIRLLKRLRLM